MAKEKTQWLRTAIEWLRCPSNTAIRRRIYFTVNEDFAGVDIKETKRIAEMVISRPRHERRLLLKAMTLNPNNFVYLNDKMVEQVISFLM